MIGLLAIALVACGDDDNPGTDAPRSDGPRIDGPGTEFKGYDADEGGEVRVEYVRFGNLMAGARVTAYAFTDPGSVDFHTYLNLNGCNDVSNNPTVWPMAMNPVAERNYLDIGGVLLSGGPQPLMVPRGVAPRDPFYRDHPMNEWFFDPAANTDSDGLTYLAPNTRMDVTFTGSSEFEAQVYDDVLYMPADFDLVSPNEAPYVLTAGQDHTFTWEVQADPVPQGYELLSLVAFTGPMGPKVICVEPNDGSITVPANLIDVVRTAYPSGGTLARQTLTHVTRELVVNGNHTGRRIDFLAVWCWATSWIPV